MEGEDNSSPYKIESIHTLVPYLFLICYDSLYTKKPPFKQYALWYEFHYQEQGYYGRPWMLSRMGFPPYGPSTCEMGYGSLCLLHEMKIPHLSIDIWS